MIRISYLFLAAALFTFGCSSTNTVTMSVQEPAVVPLPPTMKNVGIINRSLPEGETGVLETLDRVFSVKGPELDKMGAVAGLNGLMEQLQRNERFSIVERPEIEKIGNSTYGVFPAPLAWDKIEEISDEYGLDGLFSLEFYNTDTKIDYTTQRVTIEGPLGIEIPALEHHAVVSTTIKTGWRIYDPVGRNIVDEYLSAETVTTVGRGINPSEAVRALTGRTEMVQSISGDIGRNYARSILPYWTRVRRDYYVRGNDNLKMAKRRAQTGNWDGAAELWLMETENRRAKIAGRAHYNMAIINEINGNLDEALDWARIAYEDYGDKRALRYTRILRNRQVRAAQIDR
ncbi:MAG: tetratricopeptide repeat protein [Balneolaceae bacterium]|nr:MAG: tetratricopeptide repeat protein [Balneolaceae bacterium]